MVIAYLEDIYCSVTKGILNAIDHLDYHLNMNDAKCAGIQNVSSTNQTERLCNKYCTDSQPYGPKIQYGELTHNEEIFMDQLLSVIG